MNQPNSPINPNEMILKADQKSSLQSTHTIDWRHWLDRWDAQQTGYLPYREARFNAMLDVLEALMPEEFIAIDLACGPGSISQRLLTRFSKASCIAIDLDPVLLTMGQAVLGDMAGRLRWIEADLMTIDLISQVGEPQVDAVLSTTALHWLPTARLLQIYQQLGGWVRPGGVVLNGDNIPFAPHLSTFQTVANAMSQQRQKGVFGLQGMEDWEHWWQSLAQEPGMKALLEERDRRFVWRGAEEHPICELHEAGLRDAGFQEVSVIWQHMDDRVLMAVR
ncbi:MAG: class I SAM-dependent methyltransferase [Pseudanabaenales cyanobacterium]|nr:class I SAM-dependent methyltransferase [Pseudanabaenales cyanobacterium]